jgi:hypothetical protein
VSAAAAFAEMAASHAAAGRTVRQHLDGLQARYGPRAYLSGYFVADPPSKAAGVFDDLRRGGNYPKVCARGEGLGPAAGRGTPRLRGRALALAARRSRAAACSAPAPHPIPSPPRPCRRQSVGGVAVTGVRDMGVGLDTTRPDGAPSLPWAPGDLMLTLHLEGGGFLTLRASATEPKLKYYLEVAAAAGQPASAAADAAAAVEAAVAKEIVRPAERGLGVKAG